MGYLVVGDGKDFACAEIEHLPPEFTLDREPVVDAKDLIEIDRLAYVGDAILRDNHYRDTALAKKVKQITDNPIDGPDVFGRAWIAGAEALKIVIEMRQVNE